MRTTQLTAPTRGHEASGNDAEERALDALDAVEGTPLEGLRWLYHARPRGAGAGRFALAGYEPASLRSEGFAHASFRERVLASAALYLPAGPVELLQLDPRRVRAPVRYARTPRGVMPHVYGPLEAGAVAAVLSVAAAREAPSRVTSCALGVVRGGPFDAAASDALAAGLEALTVVVRGVTLRACSVPFGAPLDERVDGVDALLLPALDAPSDATHEALGGWLAAPVASGLALALPAPLAAALSPHVALGDNSVVAARAELALARLARRWFGVGAQAASAAG